MAEAEERGSEYRQNAAMLRHLARRTRSLDTRRELLALADNFEKLAQRVEAWERQGGDI